ncbi:hypothetical protein [Rhodococcus sp. NPDC003348]
MTTDSTRPHDDHMRPESGGTLRRDPATPSTFAVLGAITSQAALITGLLYYFGWTVKHAYYDYFGIDVRTLGYSTSDYLLSSIRATFSPALFFLVSLLVLLGVHRLVVLPALTTQSQQPDSPPSDSTQQVREGRMLARALTIALVAGVGSIAFVLAAYVFRTWFGWLPQICLPIVLIGGVVLLAYIAVLRTTYDAPLSVRTAPAHTVRYPWVLPLALIGVGFLAAFWAVGLYGDAHGQQEAAAKAGNLGVLTSVVVFSKDNLLLDGGGSQHLTVTNGDYGHLYTGLLLLAQTSDRYFLVPNNWKQGVDRVFVVRDNESIRVDLAS